MALLREQQIRFACGGQVRNTIAGIEQGRSWLIRSFLEVLRIGPNRQGLVMSEATIIMELYLPASLLLFLLRGPIDTFVANDLYVIGFRTARILGSQPSASG